VLELLNCLLSAGKVPGLFGPDELAKDMAALDAKRTADSHYQVRFIIHNFAIRSVHLQVNWCYTAQLAC
jgi:hypothetical protein